MHNGVMYLLVVYRNSNIFVFGPVTLFVTIDVAKLCCTCFLCPLCLWSATNHLSHVSPSRSICFTNVVCHILRKVLGLIGTEEKNPGFLFLFRDGTITFAWRPAVIAAVPFYFFFSEQTEEIRQKTGHARLILRVLNLQLLLCFRFLFSFFSLFLRILSFQFWRKSPAGKKNCCHKFGKWDKPATLLILEIALTRSSLSFSSRLSHSAMCACIQFRQGHTPRKILRRRRLASSG